MKKILIFLLCVVMLLCQVACVGGENGAKYSQIILESNYVTLGVGQNYTVEIKKFVVDDVDADKSLLDYTSSNSQVVTVDGNRITAVGLGSAYVTVAHGKTTAKMLVEVTNSVCVLQLEKSSVGLVLGKKESYDVAIETFTENGQSLEKSLIEYSSSNPSVATVENGVVRAVSSGNATITATYKGISDSLQVGVYQGANASDITAMNINAVTVQGRAYKDGDSLVFDNVNSGLEFKFYGTELKLRLNVPSRSNSYCYLGYFIDGVKGDLVRLDQAGSDVEYTIATDLEEGVHTVSVLKATEQHLYTAGDRQLKINEIVTGEKCIILTPDSNVNRLKIDFYGDSITCGAGNLGDSSSENLYTENEDGTMSYAAITGRNLNALVSMVSYSGITVKANVNVNLGTEINITNYWNKYSTIKNTAYTVDEDTDFVVINLGTNDANASGYTADTFMLEFKDLLTAMKQSYGQNTQFIWCYGMMGEVLKVKTGIQNALSEMGGENAGFYYLTLPLNQQGALLHPTVAGHQAAATVLTDFINQLLVKN